MSLGYSREKTQMIIEKWSNLFNKFDHSFDYKTIEKISIELEKTNDIKILHKYIGPNIKLKKNIRK